MHHQVMLSVNTCDYVSQEVRVRFSGFGKEEDEWVNVRTGVRERSIPLEPSECDKVNVGDLVLCFQVIPYFWNLICSPRVMLTS